jgi:hypothetical protein
VKDCKQKIIKKNFSCNPNQDSITLICVFRDEELLIPHFINYYEKMGVSHFIFIDNSSIDKSIEKISTHCTKDYRIVERVGNYSQANFGVDWATEELDLFCKNTWCGVVDIDEFILLQNDANFNQLKKEMLASKANVCEFILCEFYPKSFPKNVEPFDPFIHSDYYDNFYNPDYFSTRFYKKTNKGSFGIWGGLRKRIFSETISENRKYCLNKKLFFNYDFYNHCKLSAGMHWLDDKNEQTTNQKIKYFEHKKIVAHFKFVKPDIINFFKKRIKRNQDWQGCEEYKSYVKNFQTSFFKDGFSESFRNVNELYQKTLDPLMNYLPTEDISKFSIQEIKPHE